MLDLTQFHYLLMINQSIYQKTVMKRLAGTGLTLGQPKVLEYLSLHDGAAQKDIASACYIEPASLTAILNGMEEKGLAERRRLNGNRKNYYVFLTDKGRERYELVQKAFSEVEQETFADFSKEEQETFMALFRRLSETIPALQGESTS